MKTTDKVPVKEGPKLDLIRGGKPPGPPKGTDWLSPMLPGTVFLSKDDDRRVNDHQVVFKSMGGMIRIKQLTAEVYRWVDPIDFCKEEEFIEVLGVVPLTLDK